MILIHLISPNRTMESRTIKMTLRNDRLREAVKGQNEEQRRHLMRYLSVLLHLPTIDANGRKYKDPNVNEPLTGDTATRDRRSTTTHDRRSSTTHDRDSSTKCDSSSDVPLDLSVKSTHHRKSEAAANASYSPPASRNYNNTKKKLSTVGKVNDGAVKPRLTTNRSPIQSSMRNGPRGLPIPRTLPISMESVRCLGGGWKKQKIRSIETAPPARNIVQKWVPVPTTKSNLIKRYSKANDRQWYPINRVRRGSIKCQPGGDGSSPSPALSFPWIGSGNPLNRIFLQDSPSSGNESTDQRADHQETSKKAEEATSPVVPDSTPPSVKVCPAATSVTEPNIKLSYAQSSKSWSPPYYPEKTDNYRSILAPSKLGSQSKSASTVVLKPSTLGTSRLGGTPFTLPIVTVSSSPSEFKPAFKLKPSVLSGPLPPSVSSSSLSKNPFSVVASAKDDVDSTSPSKENVTVNEQPEPKRHCTRSDDSSESSDSPPSPKTEETDRSGSNVTSSSEVASQPVSVSSTGTTPEEQVPTSSRAAAVQAFVPLKTESPVQEDSSSKMNGVSTTSPLSSNLGSGRFIFGQNLSNRIIGNGSSAAGGPTTNGELASSEMNLFTDAATSIVPSTNATADGGKTLSESSREFSEKEESLKRKYEEVAVVTGEENEKNVIQMHCKLYGWVNGSWQERGRGILRLNDHEVRDELHSRLVIRTHGTLTVMLNAKIWAEMSIEKSNDKSVRFTATGSDRQPKIYLVMGSPKDITLLHNSLEYRVAAARSQSMDERERKDIDV